MASCLTYLRSLSAPLGLAPHARGGAGTVGRAEGRGSESHQPCHHPQDDICAVSFRDPGKDGGARDTVVKGGVRS